SCIGATSDWYTPPEIFKALRLVFDLDPCSPGRDHWVPGKKIYTIDDDGPPRALDHRVARVVRLDPAADDDCVDAFLRPDFGDRDVVTITPIKGISAPPAEKAQPKAPISSATQPTRCSNESSNQV